jgi:hypothetical protein
MFSINKRIMYDVITLALSLKHYVFILLRTIQPAYFVIFFIYVYVASQDNDQSCICLFGILVAIVFD